MPVRCQKFTIRSVPAWNGREDTESTEETVLL